MGRSDVPRPTNVVIGVAMLESPPAPTTCGVTLGRPNPGPDHPHLREMAPRRRDSRRILCDAADPMDRFAKIWARLNAHLPPCWWPPEKRRLRTARGRFRPQSGHSWSLPDQRPAACNVGAHDERRGAGRAAAGEFATGVLDDRHRLRPNCDERIATLRVQGTDGDTEDSSASMWALLHCTLGARRPMPQ